MWGRTVAETHLRAAAVESARLVAAAFAGSNALEPEPGPVPEHELS